VQALQDESRIRAEKIGSGNWYWSFISDDKIALQKALEGAQSAYEKALATDNELKTKIAEGEAQRKEDEEMLDESGETREELLGSKRLLESELEVLRRELATYSANDPAELEKKGKEAVEWKAATELCTDDIYSMESWLKETTGGGDGLVAMLRETYGNEWDEEANGLKELV
jgi:DNA repair exonuclease SbcCD ATPase subunit